MSMSAAWSRGFLCRRSFAQRPHHGGGWPHTHHHVSLGLGRGFENLQDEVPPNWHFTLLPCPARPTPLIHRPAQVWVHPVEIRRSRVLWSNIAG